MAETDVVIRVEGLGKKYILQHEQAQRHGTVRDAISQRGAALARWANPFTLAGQIRRAGRDVLQAQKSGMEEFWALKDVNFEIRRGERVGIIGRNGAGKSTLLKILSRITEPTTGRVEIRGRVASLLEVGTGFHPELTGRENIYLNGAILGMTRREIRSKFDEIVDFAEVEKFLDTPVKRYSSGMYVRLAFAVAAHLEPEILVVDEVLAVGDASFQKKCLGKMKDVSAEGRTVLFVSHNMGVLRELCQQGIWLNEGQVRFRGIVGECVQEYLGSGSVSDSTTVDLSNHRNRLKGMRNILKSIAIKNREGNSQNDFAQNESIIIAIRYANAIESRLAGVGFVLNTIDGNRVGGFNTYMAFSPPHGIPDNAEIEFNMSCSQFTPGNYVLSVSVGTHQGHLADKVEECIGFSISQSDIYGTGFMLSKEDGVVAIKAKAVIVASNLAVH